MNITLSTNSLLANTFFGSKNTASAGSFLSSNALGDWGLMRSGVYTKMLKSYYEKVNGTDTDSKTGTNSYQSEIAGKLDALQSNSSTNVLSSVKSNSTELSKAADKLKETKYDTVNRDDLYQSVKSLTDSYNTVLSSTAKSDLTSITQSAEWMKNDVKASQSLLKKVGITIGSDNRLSVDKEAFASADLSDIKSLFEGNSSWASRLSQRATGLANLAANQMTFASGKSLYNNAGLLGW